MPALAVEPVPDDSAGLPDDSMPEPESGGRIPARLNTAKANNVSQSVSALSANEPLDIYARKGSHAEQVNVHTPKASSAVKRKTKVIYTAKKKQMKQPLGILNARQKHPLVFVRASTEDGLPLPGDADVVSVGLMEELDPIQDTQLGRPPAQLNTVRVGSHVSPLNVSKQSRFVPTAKNGPQQSKRSRLPVDRIFTFSDAQAPKRRHGRLRLPSSSSLCDGFEGYELLIPAPKVHSRGRQKERLVGTPKAGANADESRGGLELASGYFPVSCPIEPKLSKSSGTMLTEHGSQLELVHPSVETDLRNFRHDSLPLHLSVEATVRSQLAGITAPLREEDEFHSSSFDEGLNTYLSRWGLEESSRSSDSGESDLLNSSSDSDGEETDYFGEAMYRMDNRDEGDFWSQYPGLD
ncbi:uncharacterized protein CC84DRAFT_1172603 [Paraphaeosphaeria sporulosa]|uniref:Transcription factor Iwr1 domain-containing protein n=1 Tax=Paraphaeosphaeria sporulosa TaxID=1460663 RepID=A0A177CT24_9PLEO|nr:uncharacterized protein CC84DRAFT_1172603 [Paraphaeosphaeria sporulosa]OAG10138.1 hypothetical protein CC84DRAFT_1172603 [Paraphaeosphaeria sporulosa]